MQDDANLDELVGTFIKIREKKARLKAEYEAAVAPYNEAADKIENLLLAKFQDMGVESIRTPNGTAYSTVKTSATMGDWDAFKEFCDHQDDPYMFIERRVSKEAVVAYKQAHGELPPGVNWSETRAVNFRK